jgi:hypothetical protein
MAAGTRGSRVESGPAMEIYTEDPAQAARETLRRLGEQFDNSLLLHEDPQWYILWPEVAVDLGALGGTRTPNLLIRSYLRTTGQVRKMCSGVHADGRAKWPYVVEVEFLASSGCLPMPG